MIRLLLLLSLIALHVHVRAQHRCSFDEVEQMNENRSEAYRQMVRNYHLRQALPDAGMRTAYDDSTVYRIPVVVHVIWSTTEQNISDARIKSQIDILNEDFRKKEGTNGFSANPLAMDAKIEFYLADIDPEGNTTDGIIRKRSSQPTYSPLSNNDMVKLKTASYWPADQYLNFWVANLTAGYLGFSSFPYSDEIDGLNDSSNILYDGIVMGHQYFGETGTGLYGYGRTATHEVGHFFGLFHPWGISFGCGNDYCNDTPPIQNEGNQNRNPFLCNAIDSCFAPGPSQIENYMDYSPDLCMNMFTQCQVKRMRTVLQTTPRRMRLYEEKILIPPPPVYLFSLSINEALQQFIIPDSLTSGTIKVYNLQGQLVDRAEFSQTNAYAYTPVSYLPQGVYILHFNASVQVRKRFAIIQKP